MEARQTRNRIKNVKKVGIMTDKEFVLSIYPEAEIDPDYVVGYFTCRFEKDRQFFLCYGDSDIDAWKNLKNHILHEMIKKLES